ncbi:DUF3618 domain-containing protein [Streptomyces pathocidini]|uniref:DUF3618 domain-containing protein n=1 Tax=Streptomyces pathocidini TaxID=1650571 RepID=A0ABW7UJW8_9ACTN|nr:DUF3618 domain-containing protein [Streptomyces pathocidini]
MSRSPGPEELRAQVAEAREKLGETVEELAAKADVKTRAQEKATAARDRARQRAAGARDRAQHKAADARDRAQHKATDARDRAQHKVAGARDRATETRHHARDTASHAAQRVQDRVHDKTPEPFWNAASRAAESGRRHPAPLAAAVGGLLAFAAVLAARGGRRNRARATRACWKRS